MQRRSVRKFEWREANEPPNARNETTYVKLREIVLNEQNFQNIYNNRYLNEKKRTCIFLFPRENSIILILSFYFKLAIFRFGLKSDFRVKLR